MKHLIAGFILASIFSLGTLHAQQTKFLAEFGGAYNRDESRSVRSNITSDAIARSSKLNGQFGIAVSKKSFVGLRYGYETARRYSTSTVIREGGTSILTDDNTQKLHAFGVFYRYYFLPLTKSRFNAFLEIDPSFQKAKFESRYTSISSYVYPGSENSGTTSISVSENYSDLNYNALDLDLKVGASYRIYKNFYAQLSISSLANVNYAPNNSGVPSEELRRTAFSLFTDPLSNTYLSLLFAF